MPEASIITDESDRQWYVWDFRAKWAYPFDPDSPVFLLVAPPGGVGSANAPFVVKGDPGPSPRITGVDFQALEWNDTTPDSARLIELSPATDVAAQVSKLELRLHKGKPGADGRLLLNPGDYGLPTAGWGLVVNPASTGFVYAPPKVGGRHWPITVTEAPPASTGGANLATVTVPAYPFAWQPRVSGTAIVTGSNSDVRVDLIARLGAAGTGPVVGRGYGIGGITDRLTLIDGPDSGSALASITVTAGQPATLTLRTEKQGGSGTYNTGASPSRFCVDVCPVP